MARISPLPIGELFCAAAGISSDGRRGSIPGHERRLPVAHSDAGPGRTDMDLTGMTTMAKIGIFFGTESRRTDRSTKPIGCPTLHFCLPAIIFINPVPIK